MIRERDRGATTEEVARTLQVFARAADTRRSYAANHAVTGRAISDLAEAFESLLKESAEIVLEVGSEALVFQGERVLDGGEPSLPLALYRDGLRRLSFTRGITQAELEVVVSAAARGLSFGGMGDDVVTALWRQPLPHVRYQAADTSVDAQGDRADRVETEIEAVMTALGSIELDAKPDDAFQPVEEITLAPAYREDFSRELEVENLHTVAERAARVLTRAWKEARREEDADVAAAKLLDMFDVALVEDDAKLATAIARHVRTLPQGAERVTAWLAAAGSEARLRRLMPMMEAQPARQDEILSVIDALGRPALPALFSMLPGISEPSARRGVSERIVRYGGDDLGPVKELINREPTFLAHEAIFILGRMATPEAQSAIRDARVHPKIHVRLALIESLRHVPAELALSIALDLLNKEEDPKVLAATARSLPRYKTKETADALETAAFRLAERALPYDTKLAILAGFASVNPSRAAPLLIKYVKRGEGLLVRRDAEELAAAAIRALGSIRGQKNNEIVEKAAHSRSKLVKEAAREVLQQAQGDAP
jgi:hypothetical protein